MIWDLWFIVGAFLAGLWFGSWITERRWRENADCIWRIESGGRLFKVSHDEADPIDGGPVP